jgi:hypothetical protein
MTTDTLLTIGISILTSALTAFAMIAHKTGRYTEKIDQLEKCNLNTRLSTLEGKMESREPLTRKKSPVSLTERGNNVLNDSGGKKFIDDNYAELKGNVETKKPATSYDIQEMSRQVVEELKEDTRINPIKEYLFKEGMEISEILDVLGIYLRDLILKEKNISTEDIDKYVKK